MPGHRRLRCPAPSRRRETVKRNKPERRHSRADARSQPACRTGSVPAVARARVPETPGLPASRAVIELSAGSPWRADTRTRPHHRRAHASRTRCRHSRLVERRPGKTERRRAACRSDRVEALTDISSGMVPNWRTRSTRSAAAASGSSTTPGRRLRPSRPHPALKKASFHGQRGRRQRRTPAQRRRGKSCCRRDRPEHPAADRAGHGSEARVRQAGAPRRAEHHAGRPGAGDGAQLTSVAPCVSGSNRTGKSLPGVIGQGWNSPSSSSAGRGEQERGRPRTGENAPSAQRRSIGRDEDVTFEVLV